VSLVWICVILTLNRRPYNLEEDVFMCLLQGCEDLSGMKSLGVEQFVADAYVLRLVEKSKVSILSVVHGDDIFAAG